MAQASTTNPADFANRRVVYLSKKFFNALQFSLRMEQFAQKKDAPAAGTLAIRFFRPRKAARSGSTGTGGAGTGIANLTEGVQNLRKTQVGVGNLDCYLNQRGDDFEISDIVRATDVLDTLSIYMKTLGADAALDLDSVMAASILGDCTTAAKAKALGVSSNAQTTLFNSNASYGVATAGYFERFAGVANTGVSANDFGTLAGLSRANGKFTRLENMRALTQLKANDVMPPDGMAYPVIVPPQVMFDIRQDVTLVGAMTQRDNKALYKWETVELDGAAFIEGTNPWQEAAGGYGTYNAAGGIFSLLYLGDEAFGTVRLSTNIAGGDPSAPKITVLDQADKSDRYNQVVAGSWKVFYGAMLILTSDPSDVPHVVALRCQSTFQ